MFPRSLNVAKHIKSMELRHSEGCFDILKEASDKLVSNQLRKWDLHLGQLNHQKDVYMEKLRIGLDHEELKLEKTLIAQHANNVMNVLSTKKRAKIERDTNEFNIIKNQFTVKSKRQRRFKKKDNLSVTSAETVLNDNTGCRITGKVKNLSSRPLTVPE